MTAAETARIAVYNLEAKAEGLRNNPGRYFPAKLAFETALAAWRETYPAEAAAESAERAASRARAAAEKAERIAGSFAARGLD